MPNTATIVASLPRLARDLAWPGSKTESATTTKPPALMEDAARCRVELVRVDAEQLAADLDAAFRRLFGPSTPPRAGKR
ncbi:MAG: hypothetical protein C0483_01960 [Pirellula sp.]|nr:hypothetical protein [Pirellula sp.]